MEQVTPIRRRNYWSRPTRSIAVFHFIRWKSGLSYFSSKGPGRIYCKKTVRILYTDRLFTLYKV